MTDSNEYTFNSDDTQEDDYEFNFDEDEVSENSDQVIIVDDDTALDVVSKPNYDFSGTGEFVDGKVEIFHLDDEGTEHSQIIDLTSPELTPDEAKELTKTIKTQTNVLYLLIARAHAGKAHIALGYKSFEEYIKQEFNYSKSYAYKLLDQAKIIEAIEQVMPEGSQVYVSDATARSLKSSMTDFIPELEEKVRDLPADEAGSVMEDLVQDYREQAREAKSAEEDDEFGGDDFGGGDYQGGGGNGGDYQGDYDVDDYDDDEEDEDAFGGEDAITVRRRYEAVYNLYSALSQFSQMPSNEDIIKTIPAERKAQVTAYLDTSVTWLQNFKEDWYKAIEGEENEGDEFSTDDDFSDDSDNNDDNNDNGEHHDENNYSDDTNSY